MRAREITEAWFDTWEKMKQAKATQSARQAIPTYPTTPADPNAPDPRYVAGEVLPDPQHVLAIQLPNRGYYYKDLRNIWYNEQWQPVPREQTAELERMISNDFYKQIPDPRLPAAGKPAVTPRRTVSRRRGI